MQKFDKFYRVLKNDINAIESTGYILISEYVDVAMGLKKFVNKSNGNRIIIVIEASHCYYLIIKNNKVVREFLLESDE